MPSRILVIAFDKDIANTLKNYLSKRGHEVKIINTIHQIIAIARRWLPNIIVIDCIVALQICDALLKHPRTSHIPIVTLQDGNSLNRQYFLELGVSDVVAKPLDQEELSLRIENWIRMVTQKALGRVTKSLIKTDIPAKNDNFQVRYNLERKHRYTEFVVT